jgi:CrcB protein
MAMITLAVGGAGGLGACARWLIDAAVTRRTRDRFPRRWLGGLSFPYGTLLINVAGSLLLGVLTGLVLHHGAPPNLAVVAGTGFCGGFTTWSTFSWESVQLYRLGHRGIGVAQVVVHLGACVGAATLGLVLTGG